MRQTSARGRDASATCTYACRLARCRCSTVVLGGYCEYVESRESPWSTLVRNSCMIITINSIMMNILCLQQDLNNCQRWAESVHGSFSAEKTSIVSNYGIAPSSSPIMDGKEISLDVKATHLGIDISVDLQFTTHLLKILKKFRKRVNLLCHMGLHLNPQSISSIPIKE